MAFVLLGNDGDVDNRPGKQASTVFSISFRGNSSYKGAPLNSSSGSTRTAAAACHRCFRAFALLCLFVVALACQAQRSATVTIDPSHLLGEVAPAAYGVGMSVYDNNFTPTDLPTKLKAAGVSALRYPGGSYSDIYHWQTHAATPGQNIYINPNDTFDNFMTRDAIPSGALPIITVNYGSNRDATGGGDPAEAAAWVRYANVEKKWNVRYWEIGNEVGGNGFFGKNGWELDLHLLSQDRDKRLGDPALSMDAYGKNALLFIAAMKAVDPSIKVGVGVDFDDMSSPPHDAPLLKRVGDKADFIIVHWYPHGSDADISVTDQIKPRVEELRKRLAQYAGPAMRNVPIAITETNGGGAGASRALFATDTFLTWFEAGAFNVEWQEMHNGFLADHANVPDDTPAEAYYGMQMAALAARPGDLMIEAQSSASFIGAHAVKRKDGGIALVLLNRHPNQPYEIKIVVPGIQMPTEVTRYDFGRANFSFNSSWPTSGPQKSTIDNLGGEFRIVLPAFTETVLIVPPQQ